MDIGDLENIEECNKYDCAYFEYNSEDKIVKSQYLCKKCKEEINKQ